MSFPYKKVLVIGATSGIGKALAEKLVGAGIATVVAGRRKENLDEFVQAHGSDKVSAKVVDITKLDQLNQFASEVIAENPDLDCVFVNSGIQRAFDFNEPAKVDLDIFEQELVTNYTAPVHLTKAFLPHLQKQPGQTALAYTTTQLAIVPMKRAPNYSASKAALHQFIICLRAQLADGPGNVKVIEVYPPAVQTELHDTKHQPDLKNGHLIGMPLNEFTDETWSRLQKGEDQIPIGTAQNAYDAIEVKRQEMFKDVTKMLDEILKDFLQ